MARFVLLAVALPAAVLGQALVEYTLGVGRAAAAAPAAKRAGDATAATLEKLGKTMGQAGQVAAKTTGRAPALGDAQKPRGPLGPFADPAQITVGLERGEVLRRFGEPSMKTTDTQGKELVETFWYSLRERDPVVVTLRDGKVAAVSANPPAKPQNTAVVIVQ